VAAGAVALMHAPSLHAMPTMQSSDEEHFVRHAESLHRRGAHVERFPSASTTASPSSEHTLSALVHTPAAQRLPGAHSASVAHALAQALPSAAQRYGAQARFTSAGHPPLPSQLAAAISTPAAHAPTRQLVSAPASAAQRLPSLPSQAAVSQALAPFAQGTLAPCGAPLTGLHLPTLPGTSHAWHCPAQRPSQQTPSTHAPEPHSPSLVHATPSFFAHEPFLRAVAQLSSALQLALPQQTPSTHVRAPAHTVVASHGKPSPGAGRHVPVALQLKPAAQSVDAEHFPLHLVAPQANAPHDFFTSLHAPTPSQLEAWVSTPSAQASLLQGAPAAASSHAFRLTPWHARPQSVPTGAPPVATQPGWPARGAPVTAVQVPFVAASAHASHAPSHLLSQQTPSTQKPL
jgi:hypothetical protein